MEEVEEEAWSPRASRGKPASSRRRRKRSRERERERGEGDLARRVIASENKSRRATECAHSLRHPGIEREREREKGE